MLATRALRAAASSQTQAFNVHTNPYKAKKIWPPDFAKLTPKHQFRLERRYKRRAKLKWARPRWTKAVKLVQYGLMASILVYGVLFMEGGKLGTPFDGFRRWVKGKTASIWSFDGNGPQQEPVVPQQARENGTPS